MRGRGVPVTPYRASISDRVVLSDNHINLQPASPDELRRVIHQVSPYLPTYLPPLHFD